MEGYSLVMQGNIHYLHSFEGRMDVFQKRVDHNFSGEFQAQVKRLYRLQMLG
jgi:hypothetical protein